MNSYPILETALADIAGVASEAEIESVRLRYLGRDGSVTKDLRSLASLPIDKRQEVGKIYNSARSSIDEAYKNKLAELQRDEISKQTSSIDMDVTAPVDEPGQYGHSHPVSSVIDDLVKTFWQMGYTVIDGPEVDTEWYNFDALLVGKDHPARDMQDTFYLEGGNLPRTHTSNMQIRHMEANKPPIRIISIGKVYRNEDEDNRHLWMFNQVEGLVVDEGVSLVDLKGTLLAMMRGVLGADTQVRLRPSYFPYVEPGVELDASCVICKGSGRLEDKECRTCSGTGWLEIGGAGMVHPQVLRNVNIDPEVYTGFAFGFGAERIAMIKHDVHDLREFWRPNLRFLEQF